LVDEVEEKGFSWKVLLAVMTVCVSLTGVITTAITKSESNDTEFFGKILQRLEAVELHNKEIEAQNKVLQQFTIELQQKILALSGENLRLKVELNTTVSRRRIYQEFIDSFPFPFWIKEVDENGDFRAWLINNSYVYKYGISKERYVGSTDAEVWGAKVAAGFEEADRIVFENKNFIVTRELVPETGPKSDLVPAHGWKFAVKIGVDQTGVAGLVVIDADITTIGEEYEGAPE